MVVVDSLRTYCLEEVLRRMAFESFVMLGHIVGTFVGNLASLIAREVVLRHQLELKTFVVVANVPRPWNCTTLALQTMAS